MSEPKISNDELGPSVLRSACNNEATELAADWADFGLDSVLNEKILSNAPIFSSVVKICALSRTIRDPIFLRKI